MQIGKVSKVHVRCVRMQDHEEVVVGSQRSEEQPVHIRTKLAEYLRRPLESSSLEKKEGAPVHVRAGLFTRATGGTNPPQAYLMPASGHTCA